MTTKIALSRSFCALTGTSNRKLLIYATYAESYCWGTGTEVSTPLNGESAQLWGQCECQVHCQKCWSINTNIVVEAGDERVRVIGYRGAPVGVTIGKENVANGGIRDDV